MATKDPDFEALWKWEREAEAAGTMFVPGDVESQWEDYFEGETGMAFAEVWPELRASWEWRKGVSDACGEAGNEVIFMMCEDYARGKRKDGGK